MRSRSNPNKRPKQLHSSSGENDVPVYYTRTFKMVTQHDEGEDRALWPPNAEVAFIELVVEEVTKCNTRGIYFQGKCYRRTWEMIQDELFKRSGKYYSVSMIKAKFNLLRKKYHAFTRLLHERGFKYNSITDTVIADQCAWQRYEAVSPYAKVFREKGCQLYKFLDIIFSIPKQCTCNGIQPQTSPGIRFSLDSDFLDSDSESDDEDDECFLCMLLYYFSDVESELNPSVKETVESWLKVHTAAVQEKKKRYELIHGLEECSLVSDPCSLRERVDAILGIKGNTNSSVSDPYSVDECIIVLETINGLEASHYFEAFEILKSPDMRKFFISTGAILREQLIKRLA